MKILCNIFPFFRRTRASYSRCPESASTFPFRFSLEGLPNDVHYLLVEELQKYAGLHAIKPLSLVSKRLRNICLPFLFRMHEWHIGELRDSSRDRALLPSKLWPYIHTFHLLVWSTSNTPQESSECEALISALPAMPSLTTFKMSATVGAWPALITGILNIPTLECLEINRWMIPPAMDQFHNVLHNQYQDTSRTPWRKFISTITLKSRRYRDRTANVVTAPVLELPADARFVHPPSHMAFRGMKLPWYLAHQLSAELCAPEIVLIPPSLKHLELQGGSDNFCNLSVWEWSNLRELVLRGSLPTRRERPANIPLIDVLVLMPRLETLDVCYKSLSNGLSPPIWPLEQPCSDSGPDPHSVRMVPPQLRNLLLSNPTFEDNIFNHLPPCLQTLDIRRPYEDSPLRPFQLDQVLQLLQASDLCSLTSLSFAICGPLEASLFAFLGRTFPVLEVLELQRHTLDDCYTEPSLGAILRESHLQHLRVLRLNIGRTGVFYPSCRCHDGRCFAAAITWAHTVASYIPWIRQISLAKGSHSWFTVDVSEPIPQEGMCRGSHDLSADVLQLFVYHGVSLY